MRLPPRRDHQREFWRWYRSGLTIQDAAERVGYEKTAGIRWLQKAGGVEPAFVKAEPSGRFLTIEDREPILVGVELGLTKAEIAARIGRHPSTVGRELPKNMPEGYPTRRQLRGATKLGRPRKHPSRYSPSLAQQRADANATRPKERKLATQERLRDEVQARLEEEHSPKQIAARLKMDFPENPEMWVSHETIYQSLFVQGRGGLRRDLAKRLRTGRSLRKPRRQTGERRGSIPGMVNISERPAEVADRAVPGHWEGDLIIGANGKSAIGTLVERTTRFVMLLHLPDGHGADAVQAAMVEAMSQLPQILRKTLTWDQGWEMRNHAQIAAATDLQIYFCDPHSPWQRGTNENTNGLLRQYFPKGADLSLFGADYLEHVARKLNTRPRETLEWKTPSEALDALLSNPSEPPDVALTG
jgi:IS30 family transposase